MHSPEFQQDEFGISNEHIEFPLLVLHFSLRRWTYYALPCSAFVKNYKAYQLQTCLTCMNLGTQTGTCWGLWECITGYMYRILSEIRAALNNVRFKKNRGCTTNWMCFPIALHKIWKWKKAPTGGCATNRRCAYHHENAVYVLHLTCIACSAGQL